MSADSRNKLKLAFVFAVILIAPMFLGCANSVDSDLIKRAEDLCEANGGLDRIYRSTNAETIYCENGLSLYTDV